MPNVTVNLAVGASAKGSISIFSQDTTLPDRNIIDTAYTLPLSALYQAPEDGSVGTNALFKFQGRTVNNDDGTIEEVIVGAYGDNFTRDIDALTSYISSILTNPLKCGSGVSEYANAEPFSDPKYADKPEYQTYESLGHLTLAAYAHYLFGHVQATAAIDNDSALLTYMNTNTPSDTTVTYTSADGTTQTTGSTSANIAYNLAYKIMYGLSTETITTIVKNVLAQDASRARFEDNDEKNDSNTNKWQHLVFMPDDVVFVQVVLDTPRLIYANNDQQFQNNIPILPITYNFRIATSIAGGSGGSGDSGDSGDGV
jgi:hypothetical protein